MVIAIHQPNYMPWLGYFHKIKSADQFVFLDQAQIAGKSFANRCFIKGKKQEKVLMSVPIKKTKGVHSTYLDCVPDYSQRWQSAHINKINDAYRKCPYYEQHISAIETLLLNRYEHLSAMNISLVNHIMNICSINTQTHLASLCIEAQGKFKNDRNLTLCKWLGADTYLSGIGALNYNDESLYIKHDIVLNYQSFTTPQYAQTGNVFIPGLSVIDALFNVKNIAVLLN